MDEVRIYRKVVAQDRIIEALKAKLAHVLMRPGMYVEDDAHEFRGLLVAYLDGLALACSGYSGAFLLGGIPPVDRQKPTADNIAALTAAAKKILDSVPDAPTC